MKELVERARKLKNLFWDNLKRAEVDMVVEDSLVEYSAYKFIRSIHTCTNMSSYLWHQFQNMSQILCVLNRMNAKAIAGLEHDEDWVRMREYPKEWIKELRSLEEELASQNEYLDKFVSIKMENS